MPPSIAPHKKTVSELQRRNISSKRSLAHAFQSFTHAADSLERSYGQLQAEVLRLRFELERTNRDLASSLEENSRMRTYLTRVIEQMPCGLLVVGRDGVLRMANEEARRLLARLGGGQAALATVDCSASAALAPDALSKFIGESRTRVEQGESEWVRTFDPQAAAAKNSSLQSGFLRRVLEGLKRIAGDQVAVASPVLLCGSPARYHLRRMLEPFIPRIVVLSPGEIPAVVSVQSIGVVQ